MVLSVGEIALAAGCTAPKELYHTTVDHISTDTRTILPGSVFVALRGERFDGHNFAAQALEQGAVAVVVEHASDLPAEQCLVVEDTTKALLAVAGLWRSRFKGKVVAVTGSVGKTTTKEMIAAILERKGRTLKTKENLNNEVGLSQMLLELSDEYRFGVFEVGVDGPGQMPAMAAAVAPNIAVVTNIGSSHLQAFHTKENIQKEKLLLAEGLSENGVCVLNADDSLLKIQGRGYQTYYYGIDTLVGEIQASHLSYKNNSMEFYIHYRTHRYLVTLPILGRHNVLDALAAFAVAMLLKIKPEEAVMGLETYHPQGMRQHSVVAPAGFTVVEDCYNASPQSMRAAVESFAQVEIPGRKIMVLADMLELGDTAKQEHTALGEYIAEHAIDVLYTTGSLGYYISQGALAGGMQHVCYYDNKLQLAEELYKSLAKDDMIWLKASRGMRLEEILQLLYGEG